ncbi:ATP dependent DNA ligase [Mycena floridula]|nr:ATP dependent DNA ligase [Mycena floridula]
MMAKIQNISGSIIVTGIDELVQKALESAPAHLQKSSFDAYHITVFTKDETRRISAANTLQLDTSNIFSVGIGGNDTVYFIVIIWAAAQQLRKRFKLPPKQFYALLTENDDLELDKGLDSLFPGQFPAQPTSELLDHVAFTCHISGLYQQAQPFCVDLCRALPDSHKGFLRLADTTFALDRHKAAMLAYACAFDRAEESKVKDYCVKRLVECSIHTEWGPIILDSELPQLPPELFQVLMSPWSTYLCQAISELSLEPSLCLEPRLPFLVPLPTKQFHKLPRFFRWLIPYHFAVMSTPKSRDDIAALCSPALGIRHVLTLTEEEPLDRAWFSGKPITNTFLPVPNYCPPSVEQMDIIIRLFDDPAKLPILVHCGGGKGRAGTVAACYLAAYGFRKSNPSQDHPEMSANDAILALRSLRPGSLETSQQEAFVSKWCSIIWKRRSIYPDLPSEPSPCSLEIEGTLANDADLFVFVGLPGSGKSWVSHALLARDRTWTRISQDESGSRSSCETEIGRNHRGRVILDRCNTAASDRKSWLNLAANWAVSPVAIWFDYSLELCTSRAQSRIGHPTLPPGRRVINAVDQMEKMFVRPSVEEGFKAVVIIRSFEAAQELVLRLSRPITLHKFPRTPHLIDLGAATSDDIVAPSSISQGQVIITEKVDGANMGFQLSADRSIVIQNRSHFVNPSTHEQFKKLGLWVESHHADLFKVLDRDPYFAERYILFGEWLYATHSIPYSHLPDRFMAFDLYDRSTATYVDRQTLVSLLRLTSIHVVPVLHEGNMLSDAELMAMIQTKSSFWDGRVEGIYVKVERDGKVVSRGKVVRGDFISGNDHWTKGNLSVNGMARGS